jgi:hypothetical protein
VVDSNRKKKRIHDLANDKLNDFELKLFGCEADNADPSHEIYSVSQQEVPE